MSALLRVAALALAVAFVVPTAGHAEDDDSDTAPFSSVATLLDLCGAMGSTDVQTACKTSGYATSMPDLDKAIQAALVKAPATIRPLLMRDQAWFYEMIAAATEDMALPNTDDDRAIFTDMIHRRLATLAEIRNGFGRPGVLGRWENALGSVTVTSAEDGAYRLAIDTRTVYGSDDRRPTCTATALIKPAADGWLTGTILHEQDQAADIKTPPPPPQPIKLRRQGDTLRIVAGEQKGGRDETRPSCPFGNQITGSYFATGPRDATAASDKIDTRFIVPTFDCVHPNTASDEEICADPELAENDQRLNRAWKALLPRLDEPTRPALLDDQRQWVRAQARQYQEFLHPLWAKADDVEHQTTNARLKLDKLQRERIALLEGFDEKRSGLAGAWISYTAMLMVTPTDDGGLKAKGRKWDQGSWKDGCDYDMIGKIVDGAFRADGTRKNPDTLERDHAMLIVNRLDDVLAAKRNDSTDPDEPKCRRNYGNSSTVRLFPVRPSPDIDASDDSIR